MEPPRNDSGDTDDERRESGTCESHVETESARSGESFDNEQTTSQDHHRRLERRNWHMQNRIAGLAAFAGCLQLVGLVLVWQTLTATWSGVGAAQQQANIAQEALASGQRPWLMFSAARLEGFKLVDKTIRVEAAIDMRNVGHGVARRTRATIDVVASHVAADMNAAAERLCDSMAPDPKQRGS